MRLAPDAIVFDCDGVLVDSDDAVVGAWSAWAVAYGFDPSAVIEVCHGQPARATVAAFLAPDDVAAGIAVIDALELELARDVRGLPGARDLLASLPEGRWGIVTSGIRVLATTRLEASGIALPGVLVTADDVTDGKPHPEGYALALQRLRRGRGPIRGVRGRADGDRGGAGGGCRDGDRGGAAGGRNRRRWHRRRLAGRAMGWRCPGRGARSGTRLIPLAMFISRGVW